MEEFQKNLKEAIRHLQIADHMAYVTFPLIREKKLLLKIFDEIYASIINSINSVLIYENISNKNNFEAFSKIAKEYHLLNEQIKKIKEIIEINQKHKESAVEFFRNDRIVILSANLGTNTISLDDLKKYVLVAKDFIVKVSAKFNFPKN